MVRKVVEPVTPFSVSPSRIARYFFHECDRFLRFASARGERRTGDAIPKVEVDRSLITRAILESGYAWEEHVVQHLLGARAVVARGDGPVRDRHHEPAATLQLLARAQAGQVLYQATLRPPPGFYAAYGLDPAVVEFLECRPDLLVVVEGAEGLEVRVVDAKASDEMKLSHRIQVALYSVLLEHVLADAGLDSRLRVSRLGGVWLYQQPEPEWFDLTKVRAPLEVFLTHDLPRILGLPIEDAFWHLYFRCEWCDYFAYCLAEAQSTRDVSLVPYLSTFAKRHLVETAGVRTLDDLEEVLHGDDPAAVLAGCASLEGKVERLRVAVDSLRNGVVHPTGAASVAMPKGEHVRVVVTLQAEPVSGATYGYAILRVNGTGRVPALDRLDREIARVARDDRPGTLARLRRDLIADLIGVLGAVDAHNRAMSEWRDQLTLQVYAFDSYERSLLVRALLDEITEPGPMVDEALSLLFWFQQPELTEAEDHPAGEVAFPVVVLTEVLRRVLALPVPVVYRLAEVSEALKPSRYPWVHRHDDYHDFAFSNRMKSNAIYDVWRRGRADLVPNIEWQLRSRVRACSSVINGLREQLGPTHALFAWPPKLLLPPGLGFAHPTLSRLSFIARYESVLACVEARTRRARTREELLADVSSYRVRRRGDGWWDVDVAQDLSRIEVEAFPQWLLTIDDPDGNRARLVYDDLRCRNQAWPPANLPLALACVLDVDGRRLRLDLKESRVFTAPGVDRWCWLDARWTDYTTDRLLGELAAIDADPHPWFVDVVDDPVGTRAAMVNPRGVADTARRLARQFGMTRSQLEVFDGVLDHDLQAVWGPPGTGKTHWLALAVLCLAEAHRRAGVPLRVLITSFTHAAIDNCLTKLRSLHDELGIVSGSLLVAKVEHEGRYTYQHVPALLAGHQLVVIGSTVWQIARLPAELATFDVVVIDEGSQLECADAAIAVRRVAGNGRLVVCGDDDQLPPIVAGEYPNVDGGPPLHRSILEVLRHADPLGEHGLVRPLLENFRMNDRLCEYPRHSLYPEGYQPATTEIASRRLAVRRLPRDRFLATLLDPDYPVVVCVAEDVHATRENPIEAAVVADLADAARTLLDCDDDEHFWRDRLFVVSPHHSQINLIRKELARRRTWGRTFVDTVDKMQGQECDLVVVSYGVSDVEYALSEREFIYSRNRLNVAITRARTKTIVLLSRVLLEPPVQALDRDDVAEGIAYLQGWARWCEQQSAAITLTRGGQTFTILRG